MGAIDDGEGAGAQGGVHFAGVFSRGFFAFDDDGWRRRSKAGEEVEDPGAGFFGLGGAVVEGEGQIDDGDVDWVGFDDTLGSVGGGSNVGFDAHWVEDHGEAINPRGVLPACVGEQEVEAACRCEALIVVGMGGFEHHDVLRGVAKGVPVWRGIWGRNWGN